VKIKIFHTLCGREVLVRQILDSGGHCPWDGRPFEPDYTAVLAEALETAEEAGGVLENALEKIAGMEPAMTIDEDSVIAPLAEQLHALNHDAPNRYQGARRP
jgi:hypothetical protein